MEEKTNANGKETKEKWLAADVIETIDKYHRASGHANVGSCVSESVLFSKLLKKYHRIDSNLSVPTSSAGMRRVSSSLKIGISIW